MIDTRMLCREVGELAHEVGNMLRDERRRQSALTYDAKGIHDYVTRYDRLSEQRIVERLRKLLPEGDFIAEEGSAADSGKERYVWIVDPIDGTTNFIHSLAPTCISIALCDRLQSLDRKRPVMLVGVVHELWAEETFAACADQEGAFLNGNAIGVTQASRLNDTLLATGFPYTNFDRLEPYMAFLAWTMRNTHGVRRMGSAAADLAYVACGRMDGFYEYGLKPYDVAAGAYLVEKAGGRNGDFSGGANWLFGGEMLSSNPLIFDALVAALKEHRLG